MIAHNEHIKTFAWLFMNINSEKEDPGCEKSALKKKSWSWDLKDECLLYEWTKIF